MTNRTRNHLAVFFGTAGSFKNQVSSTMAAQLMGLVLATAQGVVLARWLGTEGKGVVALAMLVSSALAMLLNPGLTASYVFHAAGARLPLQVLTRHAVTFSSLAGLAGIALFGLGLATGVVQRLLPGVPTAPLLLAVAALPVTILSALLGALLHGQQRIRTLNVVTVARAAVVLVLTVAALIGLGLGPVGAVGAILAGTLVTVAAFGWLLQQDGDAWKPGFERTTATHLLHYGTRAHAGNLAQFFNYRLDMFVVNFIAGPAAVGIYTVAVRLAELVWQLPNAAAFAMFPRAASRSREEMNRFTPRVFVVTLAGATVAAIGLAAVGRFAIRLLYSEDFLAAYLPLLLLLPGTVLLGGAKVLTNDLAGRGFPHYNAITATVALVVTVGLDIVLVPAYGVAGAAVASTVAYTVTLALAGSMYRGITRGNPETEPRST